jgi:hypothetical protein
MIAVLSHDGLLRGKKLPIIFAKGYLLAFEHLVARSNVTSYAEYPLRAVIQDDAVRKNGSHPCSRILALVHTLLNH